MRRLVALQLIALAGCATQGAVDQTPRAPVTVGVEAKVGVREKCKVTLPPEPLWQVDITPATASEFEKSKAALAELEQRRAWEVKAKAEAKKCD